MMGTKGDVLLVMVAASLAARAVACSRSIKISANVVVPPLVRGGHWAQCSRADVMAITKCRSVENASPPLRSAVWHRSCESYPDRASIRYWGKGWTMGRIVFCARHAYLARLDNVTV